MNKRTRSAGLVLETILPPPKKKRQAFNAPKSDAIKVLGIRNSLESPLFRLPPEIRNKIWAEVLGNQIIYVEYSADENDQNHPWSAFSYYWGLDDKLKQQTVDYDFDKWTSSDCEAAFGGPTAHSDVGDGSNDDSSDSDRDGDSDIDDDSNRDRDGDSDSDDDSDSDSDSISESSGGIMSAGYFPTTPWWFRRIKPTITPRIQMLRTCRQLYLEANPILWSTNTFSFDDPTCFRMFVDHLNHVQRKLLKHISLTLKGHCDQDMVCWNAVLSKRRVKSLLGLCQLTLYIDSTLFNGLRPATSPYSQPPYCFLPFGVYSIAFLALFNFKYLPLERVQVKVREGFGSMDRLENTDVLEWISVFEKLMLIANGRPWSDKTKKQKAAEQKKKSERIRKSKEMCISHSQAACIEAQQAARENGLQRINRADRPRRAVTDHCGRMHRGCECQTPLCEHIEHPDSVDQEESSDDEDILAFFRKQPLRSLT